MKDWRIEPSCPPSRLRQTSHVLPTAKNRRGEAQTRAIRQRLPYGAEGRPQSCAPRRFGAKRCALASRPSFQRYGDRERHSFELDECRKLLPMLSPDFRELVRGALYTGARLMELCQMTAADFNPAAGSIHIPPSKTFRARHVVLSEEGRTFFAAKVANLARTDLIFGRTDGQAWRAPDPAYRLRLPCQLAGLPKYHFMPFGIPMHRP